VVVASIFFSTLLLSFAATLLIAGLFGAYFGKGRSRSVGFALALVAVLLIALFCSLTWNLVPGIPPIFDQYAVGRSMAAVAAAILGTGFGTLLFVKAITR
jgi:hypothetical protein